MLQLDDFLVKKWGRHKRCTSEQSVHTPTDTNLFNKSQKPIQFDLFVYIFAPKDMAKNTEVYNNYLRVNMRSQELNCNISHANNYHVLDQTKLVSTEMNYPPYDHIWGAGP